MFSQVSLFWGSNRNFFSDYKIFSIFNQTYFRMQTLISKFENQIMSENLVLKIPRRSVSRWDSQCRILIISVDLTKPLWRLLFIFSTIKIQLRKLKKSLFLLKFSVQLVFSLQENEIRLFENSISWQIFLSGKNGITKYQTDARSLHPT